MSPSRRSVLRFGGSVGLASLAGCNGLLESGGTALSLSVLNFTTEERLVRVQLLWPDAETSDAATVARREFLVDPRSDGGSPGTAEQVAVARARPYVVRASLGGNTGDAKRHAHYFPPERGGAGDGGPTVHVEVRSDGGGEPRLDVF